MNKLLIFLLVSLFTGPARGEVAGLLQLVDYVGVDYPQAVSGGEVINADEYAEMQEFARHIAAGITGLDAAAQAGPLPGLARQLQSAIDSKAEPSAIAEITRRLRQGLMENANLVLTPRQPPDLQQGQALYQQHCALCHGMDARGDGPAAAGLDPAPIDFHDAKRAGRRSLFGLYNTITLGVEGTSMTGYSRLSDAQRWSLAFYVGSLYLDPATSAAGDKVWGKQPVPLHLAVTLSPQELAARYDNGQVLSAWLRTHPAVLFARQSGTIAISLRNLGQSLDAYRAGKVKKAEDLALAAYLDGFELSEAALANISRPLVHETEKAMLAFRTGIGDRLPAAELQARYDAATALLHEAHTALTGESLSPSVAFTSSLIILLREGLEAILVLAAMVAFLIKTGRRDAMHYLHAGWLVALALGLLTWWASSYLINITGSTREVTEGATALFASAILLYVGFWMHGNSNAQRWNRYLRGKLQEALDEKTLWAIFLLAFLAVYREAFETVLFYQALWAQVATGSRDVIAYGAVLAALLLVAVVWLTARFSVRIPLRQFFIISAVLMVVLAVIFAGQGIAALQEAGKVSIYPLPIPRIELLGIFPNAQGTILQVIIIVLAIAVARLQRRKAGIR
jgi:high-affinity iron transporter